MKTASELEKLKWQWQLNCRSPHAVVALGCEGPDDKRAEARLVGHHRQTGTVLAGVKRSRYRCSVGTADSAERAHTAGVAGSGLSGTAGRLAAPLRGRHSRREVGRCDHLSMCRGLRARV